MHISQVEEILSVSRLPKPQHILIVNESVWGEADGQVAYRGLQPRSRSDTIVLTPHAITETPGHECAHTLGFGEFGASVVGKLAAMKYRVLNHFPNVKSYVQKQVKYEKCNGNCEFPKAHAYGDKVSHFRLVR